MIPSSGHANFPGWKVRKQTRDIVALAKQYAVFAVLEFACLQCSRKVPLLHVHGRYAFTLGATEFFSDDFVVCGRGLLLLHYMIGKVRTVDENWLSIKVFDVADAQIALVRSLME